MSTWVMLLNKQTSLISLSVKTINLWLPQINRQWSEAGLELRSQSSGRKRKDRTKCAYYTVEYSAKNDPRKSDEWLGCQVCNSWLHESCAEIVGIIDDDGFTRKNCISDQCFGYIFDRSYRVEIRGNRPMYCMRSVNRFSYIRPLLFILPNLRDCILDWAVIHESCADTVVIGPNWWWWICM